METPQVPKKSKPPELDFQNLPGMAEIFKSVLPRQIPPIEYREGISPIFDNFIHNWKLKQMVTESARLADLEENDCRLVKVRIEKFMELLTIGEEYQTRLMRARHERKMMEIEEDKEEAEVDQKRMTNLISKGEYQRIMAEVNAVNFQLEQKNAVETENGQEG